MTAGRRRRATSRPGSWCRAAWCGLLAISLAGCGWFGPAQPRFTARGKVVDAGGRALPGAVVTDGQGSVLTDEGGRFALAVFGEALSIAKPGHAIGRAEASGDRDLTVVLGADDRPPVVALDRRWADADLDGLRETLTAAAGPLSPYPGTALARLDVLVIVAPGAIPPAERGAIASWVRRGGRLVLCGEWGGYPDLDLGTLNALAEPAGLALSGGTVKLPGETPLVVQTGRATPTSLGRAVGDEPVTLYAASDVRLSGAARPVLAPAVRAYAVLATAANPVVAGVGPAGLGKVFALGDSSLWRDADSEGRGVPNLRHGGNARLAAALIGW